MQTPGIVFSKPRKTININRTPAYCDIEQQRTVAKLDTFNEKDYRGLEGKQSLMDGRQQRITAISKLKVKCKSCLLYFALGKLGDYLIAHIPLLFECRSTHTHHQSLIDSRGAKIRRKWIKIVREFIKSANSVCRSVRGNGSRNNKIENYYYCCDKEE